MMLSKCDAEIPYNSSIPQMLHQCSLCIEQVPEIFQHKYQFPLVTLTTNNKKRGTEKAVQFFDYLSLLFDVFVELKIELMRER